MTGLAVVPFCMVQKRKTLARGCHVPPRLRLMQSEDRGSMPKQTEAKRRRRCGGLTPEQGCPGSLFLRMQPGSGRRNSARALLRRRAVQRLRPRSLNKRQCSPPARFAPAAGVVPLHRKSPPAPRPVAAGAQRGRRLCEQAVSGILAFIRIDDNLHDILLAVHEDIHRLRHLLKREGMCHQILNLNVLLANHVQELPADIRVCTGA